MLTCRTHETVTGQLQSFGPAPQFIIPGARLPSYRSLRFHRAADESSYQAFSVLDFGRIHPGDSHEVGVWHVRLVNHLRQQIRA